MMSWKRAVATAAMFALGALVAVAGQAPGEGREGRGARPKLSPEEQAQVDKTVSAVLVKAFASELSIDEAKAKKIIDAYAEVQTKAREGMRGAQGDQEKMRELMTKMREDSQKVLTDNLTEEQAQKARPLLMDLESSIRALAEAKVEQAKIEKALPVLLKYSKESAGMSGRGAGGGDQASRDERREKMTKLREATAKELAPIVGEEAAAQWQRRAGAGMRGMGGGKRGAGQQGAGGEAAPVAP